MSNGEDCDLTTTYCAVRLDNEAVQEYSIKFGLTEECLRRYLDAFSVFDRDCDGLISPEELARIMGSLGIRMTMEEFEALLGGIHTRANGIIDFDCFLHVLTRKSSANPLDELKEVFCVFDLNRDGFISTGELYDLMERMGETTSLEVAQEMIKEADANSDGQVDLKEFLDILTTK